MHLCGQHKARNHLPWPANTVTGTGITASYANSCCIWLMSKAPLHLACHCHYCPAQAAPHCRKLTLHLAGQRKAYKQHYTWPAIVTSLAAPAAPHCMQLTLHLAGQLVDSMVISRPWCCSCQA